MTKHIPLEHYGDLMETIMIAPKLQRTSMPEKNALVNQKDTEDVLVGAKLPLIPGSHLQLFTRFLTQRMYHDPCTVDRNLPPDVAVGTDYRCLNDHFLRNFFYNRASVLNHLQGKTMLTRRNKIVSSLKEYNANREYLKYLQVKKLNEMMQEQYIKHSTAAKVEKKAMREKRRTDPNNPITRRLQQAKAARDEMDRVREIKGRKILRQAAKDRRRIILEKKEAMEKKIEAEIKREKERENKTKNKTLRIHKQDLMRKELMKFKYEEDKYRLKQLDEHRRIQDFEKERNTSLRFERKQRYKLMKMSELRKLWEQEAVYRQHDIEVWRKYFMDRSALNEERLRNLIERNRQMRNDENQKILNDLTRRGWNALRHYNPEAYRNQLKESEALFGKIKDIRMQSRSELSHLDDAMIRDGSRRYLDEFASPTQWMVHKAIDMSKNAMLPLFMAYEERNKLSRSESEVPALLKTIYHDFLRASIKRKGSTRSKAYVISDDATTRIPTINIEDDSVKTQLFLDQAIREISRRVVEHVTHRHATTEKLEDLRDSLRIRINNLANSVIGEILRFSSATASRVSASPSSASSRTITSTTQFTIDRKLTALSKIMVDEVFGGKKPTALSEGVMTEKMSSLAFYIAHSAIHTAAVADTEGFASNREFYSKIAPMVENLSYKIVGEVMKERRGGNERNEKGFAKFERKISKLALNVVQTVLLGKDMPSSQSDASTSTLASVVDVVGNSISHVLKSIAKFQKSTERGKTTLDTLTERDLKFITMKVAKRTTPPCDQSDSLLAAIHVLATAMATEALSQSQGDSPQFKQIKTESALRGLAEAVVTSMDMPFDLKKESLRSSLKKSNVKEYVPTTDNTESILSSAVSDLAENIVKTTLKIDTMPGDKLTPRNTDTAISSAVSELAELTAKSVLKTDSKPSDNLTPRNTDTAISSAVSELAEHAVKSVLRTDKTLGDNSIRNTDSALSSAANELAEHVVKCSTKLDEVHPPSSFRSTESVMNSAVSELAENVVRSSLNINGIPVVPTPEGTNSAISSAISDLAENVVDSTLKTFGVSKIPPQSDQSGTSGQQLTNIAFKRFSEILGLLIQEFESIFSKSISTTKLSTVEHDLNDVVSKAVIQTVITMLANYIEKKAPSIRKNQRIQLKSEIKDIVKNLFDFSKTTEVKQRLDVKPRLLTVRDRSIVSSIANSIAEKILQQMLGGSHFKIKKTPLRPLSANQKDPSVYDKQISDAVKSLQTNSEILKVDEQTLERVEKNIHYSACKALTKTICDEVLTRLHSSSQQKIDQWHEKELKKDVGQIVLGLMEKSFEVKISDVELEVGVKKVRTKPSLNVLSSMSSASSAVAENLMQELVENLAGKPSDTSVSASSSQTSLSSALSDLAGHLTNEVLTEILHNIFIGTASSESTQSEISSALSDLALQLTNQVLSELVENYSVLRSEMDSRKLKQHGYQGLYSKSMEMIYHTSFVDWKKDMLIRYGITEPSAVFAAEHSLKSRAEVSKQIEASSALLDDLSSQVIKSVSEYYAKNKGRRAFELTDSDSAQSLVENTALEIVTSLLDLGKNRSRPCTSVTSSAYSSRPTSPARLTSRTKRAPPISAGTTPIPPKDEPAELTDNLEKESCLEFSQTSDGLEPNDSCCDMNQIQTMLSSSTIVRSRSSSPVSDVAFNHPHRVPSPPLGKKESGNLGIRLRFRFRPKQSSFPLLLLADTNDFKNRHFSGETEPFGRVDGK